MDYQRKRAMVYQRNQMVSGAISQLARVRAGMGMMGSGGPPPTNAWGMGMMPRPHARREETSPYFRPQTPNRSTSLFENSSVASIRKAEVIDEDITKERPAHYDDFLNTTVKRPTPGLSIQTDDFVAR